MRILLLIGPDHTSTDLLHRALADNFDHLIRERILVPRCFDPDHPPALLMAVTDPAHIDQHRVRHDVTSVTRQQAVAEKLQTDLAAEIAQNSPEVLILPVPHLAATLHRPNELSRLKAWLTRFSADIRIIAHIDAPARLLLRHYAAQVMAGRTAPLSRDLDLTTADDWWQAALDTMPGIDPLSAGFVEVQAPPFWLDYDALRRFWETAFRAGSLTFRPFDPVARGKDSLTRELRACTGLTGSLKTEAVGDPPPQPSAAWLTRARQLNELLQQITATRRRRIPLPLWRTFLKELRIEGPPLKPADLPVLSGRFADPSAVLDPNWPKQQDDWPIASAQQKIWTEADPKNGFRASQYLLSFMYRIDKTTREARKPEQRSAQPARPDAETGPSRAARAIMPAQAIENYGKLRASALAPHNRMGAVDEEQLAAAYAPATPRPLTDKSTGKVIVGCMKNEAPYIVEWVAHHRAIGVDNFLIYTNDCSDGTTEILDRLQAMGVVQHVNNDAWKGKSPQQFALNRALRTPLVRAAEWILHIDVDEFINVRTGNGTLDDFLAHVPDATNIAMTWRMFGHNGITELSDRLVIDQFDRCAPKYCPKPHTAWGFKTMSRNIGAYEKLSCHRPNKLDAAMKNRVQWVNGSGRDMTGEVVDNGWRNSRKSIGYDLMQLNHYALRSAESFLIKRQRGRALHVDRSIGLNYWIRMDWSDVRDITIKRNLPRVRMEYDRLMADPALRARHENGLAWHRAKAAELRGTPEFETLLQNALRIKLTETERVAYALALDMES